MMQKLLVVDENTTIQRVVKLAFKDEQIRVVTVPRGRDPLDHIEQDPPDIVLADNGREVAAFVKQRPQLSGIPVILLRGAFDEVGSRDDDAEGCDAVLMKPLQPQAMIDRVKRLLRKRAAESAAKVYPSSKTSSSKPAQVPPPNPELDLDRYFDDLATAFGTAENSPVGQTEEGWGNGFLAADTTGRPVAGQRSTAPRPDRQASGGISDVKPDAGADPVDSPASTAAMLGVTHEQVIELITQRVLDRLADRVTRATATELVARLSKWLLVDEVERSRA